MKQRQSTKTPMQGRKEPALGHAEKSESAMGTEMVRQE